MRRALLLTLMLLTSGCASELTSRLDLLNYELDTNNRQLALLNQKLDANAAQVNDLSKRLDTANQRFEGLENVLNRLPILGPPKPAKPSPPSGE